MSFESVRKLERSLPGTPRAANDGGGRAELLRAWDLLFEDPTHRAALVIADKGVYWPSWLSAELAGIQTSLVIVQSSEEADEQLLERIERRTRVHAVALHEIVWLRAEGTDDTSWALKLVAAIADWLAPDYRVRVTHGRESGCQGLRLSAELESGVTSATPVPPDPRVGVFGSKRVNGPTRPGR
jgi:hypothetical protein